MAGTARPVWRGAIPGGRAEPGDQIKSIFRYRHAYPMAIEAVASGKINFKGIVTDVFPVSDIQHAMDESVRNKADIVKAVIKIEE